MKGKGFVLPSLAMAARCGRATRKGGKEIFGVKMGNVRIFGLKRGVRVSSFKEKQQNEKQTNVRVLVKRWQLSLEKTPLYVIIGPVATR